MYECFVSEQPKVKPLHTMPREVARNEHHHAYLYPERVKVHQLTALYAKRGKVHDKEGMYAKRAKLHDKEGFSAKRHYNEDFYAKRRELQAVTQMDVEFMRHIQRLQTDPKYRKQWMDWAERCRTGKYRWIGGPWNASTCKGWQAECKLTPTWAVSTVADRACVTQRATAKRAEIEAKYAKLRQQAARTRF